MKIEYVNSSSTVEPTLLDDTSSSIVVYIRKNVTTREEPQEDGSVVLYYDYKEATINKEDWKYFENIFDLDNNQKLQDEMLLDIDFRVMLLEERE